MREECRLRVFENRVLRRMFGPWRDKVTGEQRNLNNEELNDQLNKNEMGGALARMGDDRFYRVLVGKSVGKRPLRRPDVDGRIILRLIFRKWVVRAWTGSNWLKIGPGVRHLWIW